MKYLIVTADDFGLAKSINDGIRKVYKDGVVNFLSFIPTGEAFADAVSFAGEMKLGEIGAHLALTQTSPVTDPGLVPTLLPKDKKFYRDYAEFLKMFFLGRVDPDEMYLELKNQLEALKKTGVPVTNISSHEHIHMVPAILKIFIRLAKEYNIATIRCLHGESLRHPFTVKKLYKSLLLRVFSGGMENMLRKSGIRYTSHFLGFLDSGVLQEKVLVDMLKSLKDGTTELVCHPGFMGPEILDRCIFHANCETETLAFTSRGVKGLIAEEGIKLIKYGQIGSLPPEAK